MKRIRAACLQQTIHFQLKENISPAAAAQFVREEYEAYKRHLDKTKTGFIIDREEILPDGSIEIDIRRQYNNYDGGKYMEQV